jgi:hypothetical protein
MTARYLLEQSMAGESGGALFELRHEGVQPSLTTCDLEESETYESEVFLSAKHSHNASSTTRASALKPSFMESSQFAQ